DAEVAAALRTRLRDSHERMARGFTQWIEAGTIPSPPATVGFADGRGGAAAHATTAAHLATAFRAVVLGLVLQRRVAPDLVDVDSAERALATVLDLHGIRTPSTSTSTASATTATTG
ncbi:MAG TPA: hypothetical protein VMU09_09855, partial [Acidimicrobiales bacterium]|nr:hypothetical protein [Acidimicrobiales bacterium]